MRVISKKRLADFWKKHSPAESPLLSWHTNTRQAQWNNFAELRATFSAADQYENKVIFDIGGNKYRLIAAVHYNTKCVFVLFVLTHKEYDLGNWKNY